MKRLQNTLKILSLGVILSGLLVAAIDEWGFLVNRKRIAFYERLFHSSAAIPRNTEGFDDFLSTFPPPAGTLKTSVSAIAPRRLTTDNDGDDVWSSIRYTINGQTSQIVANQPDVQEWALKTLGTKVGLFIVFVGFLVAVVEHVSSMDSMENVQSTSPNDGPATRVGNSGVTAGPPSVS